MFGDASPLEWPFAVVALSDEGRAAVVESDFDAAFRRTRRLLVWAGAAHLIDGLPKSRTPFAIEGRSSYGVVIQRLGLSIHLVWLRLRSRDSAWPRPRIVAGLDRNRLLLPALAPDPDSARAWAAHLRQRGLAAQQLLVLPATDRRERATQSREFSAVGELDQYGSVVEELLRSSLGEEPGSLAASWVSGSVR